MPGKMGRREFVQLSVAGSALCLASSGVPATATVAVSTDPRLLSPGCRTSKVKVARLYLGTSHGLWPRPNLDFDGEVRQYRAECEKRKDELADVDFVVDQVVTSAEDVRTLRGRLQDVDGILAIHLNIGIMPALRELLAVNRPTMLFAQPYSGHEWVGFAGLQQEPLGQQLGCILSSDFGQLAAAVRPFRAMHHLREAKILNVTSTNLDDVAAQMKKRFGTELVRIDLDRLVACYNSIDEQRRGKKPSPGPKEQRRSWSPRPGTS